MKTCKYGVYNPTIDEVEPCGNLVEGNTTMCASHNAFFRKLEKQNLKAQEKRNTLIAKQRAKNQVPRKRVKPVSEKRKSEAVEYSLLRIDFLEEHKYCEIVANVFCTEQATDIHHSAGRVGENFLDVTKWKSACRSCHNYVHDHPKEAIEKGWSESRLATTEPHKI